MTSVFESIALTSGYAPARAGLRALVETAMSVGKPLPVRLRAALGPASLAKTVLVSFSGAHEGTRFDEVWAIRWTPENGGPYPDFGGLLSVQYAPGGFAKLEIRGEYKPPLGALGKGFDLVLGQRIASETCRNLLSEFGRQIEQRSAG